MDKLLSKVSVNKIEKLIKKYFNGNIETILIIRHLISEKKYPKLNIPVKVGSFVFDNAIRPISIDIFRMPKLSILTTKRYMISWFEHVDRLGWRGLYFHFNFNNYEELEQLMKRGLNNSYLCPAKNKE